MLMSLVVPDSPLARRRAVAKMESGIGGCRRAGGDQCRTVHSACSSSGRRAIKLRRDPGCRPAGLLGGEFSAEFGCDEVRGRYLCLAAERILDLLAAKSVVVKKIKKRVDGWRWRSYNVDLSVAALAQSVEHWIVIPGVTGSIPVCRPKLKTKKPRQGLFCFQLPGCAILVHSLRVCWGFPL